MAQRITEADTPGFETYGGPAPENYERYFVPQIGEPVARDLVDRAAPSDGEKVVDIACGTGIVARIARERVGRTGTVAGIDPNQGMLAVARAADATIEWHQSTADATPLSDGWADLLTCQFGLQFFPDKPAALREMARITAPGGRLAIASIGPIDPVFGALRDALTRHAGDQVGRFIDVVFALHDPAEMTDLLEQSGWSDVDVVAETKTLFLAAPAAFLWQYVRSTPLVEPISALDDAMRSAIERDVVGAWRGMVVGGALTFDAPCVFVTANR